MHEKALETKKVNNSRQGLEEWIEAGNQLHDHAIFDFFARLLTGREYSVKQKNSAIEVADLSKGLRFRNASRFPT